MGKQASTPTTPSYPNASNSSAQVAQAITSAQTPQAPATSTGPGNISSILNGALSSLNNPNFDLSGLTSSISSANPTTAPATAPATATAGWPPAATSSAAPASAPASFSPPSLSDMLSRLGMGFGAPASSSSSSSTTNTDSGFHVDDGVVQAIASRLQPDIDQARDREIQRLKAQGITEGTPAWQAALATLGRNANDASMQSILGGASAYQDIVKNQIAREQIAEQASAAAQAAAVQAAASQRSYDLGMAQLRANQDLAQQQLQLQTLNSLGGYQLPGFASYSSGSSAAAPDIYGAAQQSYQGALGNANAQAAANANSASGLLGLATSVALAPVSGGGSLIGKLF